jgi:hypothetical protein
MKDVSNGWGGGRLEWTTREYHRYDINEDVAKHAETSPHCNNDRDASLLRPRRNYQEQNKLQ